MKTLQYKYSSCGVYNKGDTSNNRATWTISKPFRKYVSHIPGNHEVKELQKTVILGTAHIFGKYYSKDRKSVV